jgi:hypothetical protein
MDNERYPSMKSNLPEYSETAIQERKHTKGKGENESD